MGLDMYLTKKRFLWSDEERKSKAVKKLSAELNENLEMSEVRFDAMYWRKANHFHNWFVSNVQDGNDDCGEYYVSIEQLKELRDTCRKVLADHSLAEELLPTQSGFFFGGTDYDDWYFESVQETADKLDKLIDSQGKGDYYYSSSW